MEIENETNGVDEQEDYDLFCLCNGDLVVAVAVAVVERVNEVYVGKVLGSGSEKLSAKGNGA